MRELDCDFCGAAAAGAYEVLPPELEPGPREQVRVVLCGSCRQTLDGVLAPLLDRLGVGERARSMAADAAGHGRPQVDADRWEANDRATASDTDGDGDGTDAGAGETEPDADAEPVETADSGSADEEPADADPLAEADAGGTDAGRTDASDSVESDSAESDDGDDGDTASGGGREPEGFRTVMRLLNNREFPVDRGEVVDLASGAYEMEAHQVEAILEYAVERGILADNRGTLHKG